MTNALFYSNFAFNTFSRKSGHQVDNSGGVGCHFLGFIKNGRAKIVSDRTTLEVRQNELFYIPKGLCYRSYWYSDNDSDVCFDSYGFQNIPVPNNDRYVLQALPQSEKTRSLLKQLSENMDSGCMAVGLFYVLLSTLLDSMIKEAPNRKKDIVDKARCYMLRHDNFSIGDVAKYCSVSLSAFYAVFKEITGTTPQDAKNNIRIQRCCELLTVDGCSVEEVSERMGFSSSSYFRKVFKKYTGLSPSEVRRNNRFLSP